MKRLLSSYQPIYPTVLVYMLQSTEYKPLQYLQWLKRVKDFRTVMYRRTLDKTKVARLLLFSVRLGMLIQIIFGLTIVIWGLNSTNNLLIVVGFATVVIYPIFWAYLVILPLQMGRWFIINPRYRKQVKASEKYFVEHKGLKIAVAGSYGKTSMKELLVTVLSQSKKVVATPENKNVAISHARFAKQLSGDEDVLIIEYGEEAPGDVASFAKITHPDIGIITGVAPAHLNSYPNLQAAGEDIFSLADYVAHDNLYVNKDSLVCRDFIKKDFNTYDSQKAINWTISNIKVGFDGTSFEMKRGSQTMKLHSKLLGRHQVGPLAFVAALAEKLEVPIKQIEKGIQLTNAFEHRMELRKLSGAWLIDDTYNGNIEGMKAGLKLLEVLPGKRKIYVTPGLVDQGVETERVHLDLGQAIASAKPDRVVLMYNSATRFIQNGLDIGSYKGKVQIEHYPLDFYANLEHIIAEGDVVMMQNDWTDNYG